MKTASHIPPPAAQPDRPARDTRGLTAASCLVRCGRTLTLLLLATGWAAAQAQPHRGPDRDGGRDGGRYESRDNRHNHGRDGHRGTPGRWYDGAHGNNRYYPHPGWAVHGAPSRSRVVVWGGVNYRYLDSVWYAPGPRGYVVVRPPFGAVIRERPAFFSLVTIGAIAYLYANGVYYREHQDGGYEVVPPPVEGSPTAAAVAAAQQARVYVYPRGGQSAQQQASDEYECHQWAVSQSGWDPTASATGQQAPAAPVQRDGYQRANSACLDGRGYTVR